MLPILAPSAIWTVPPTGRTWPTSLSTRNVLPGPAWKVVKSADPRNTKVPVPEMWKSGSERRPEKTCRGTAFRLTESDERAAPAMVPSPLSDRMF